MNLSLRPPENFQRMLVLPNVTMQSIVKITAITNVTPVSKSNNIIFTLNLSNY